MAGAAILKIGQGFGTWLIPIIIFGALGSIAIMSLIAFVCVYSCRPRRDTTDQEPEMTYETYRTPTIPYQDHYPDSPVDPTIGRLIKHSRSLHVVSSFKFMSNHKVLILTSHATNRSTDIVSDPKSVLQNYAIPLDLHRTCFKRWLHPYPSETHDHKDKYTLTRFPTQDTHISNRDN